VKTPELISKNQLLLQIGRDFIAVNRKYIPIILSLIIVSIIMSLLSPAFFSLSNFLDITRVVSITGIMALGMTAVVLIGGIDLSVGSIFALSGAIGASFITGSHSNYALANMVNISTPLAVIIGILAGAIVGFINGFIINKFKIEAFIMTLGTMSFARGLTYLYSGGFPVIFHDMPKSFAWLGKGYIFGLPTPTGIFLILAFVFFLMLKYTAFGRSLYAIGGNPQAANLSGINIGFYRILTFTISGALAGLSGIIMASRIASASPIAGIGEEMNVIAAVVLGGASLKGGKGTVFGTILGLLIIGVIQNGLNLLGVASYYQHIFKGFIIILAVAFDGHINRK
jgi:ribose/xylose/arabinose/galactoside ABC-type transport system permease subunit